MDKFKKELIEFIDKSTSCYTCIKEIKKELEDNGYIELYKMMITFYKTKIIRNKNEIIFK